MSVLPVFLCLARIAAPPVGGGDPCLQAIALEPAAGQGDAAVFRATYRHCEGAATFRVVQLWVGAEVSEIAERVHAGYEAGRFNLENGGDCAPGDPVVLQSTYGALDCAASTVTMQGTDMMVEWAIAFDVDTFAGVRGVFFDAKGGAGDPEPRLGWTQMGTFTVEPAAGTDEGTTAATDEGTSDGGDGQDTGETTTGTVGASTGESGGLPGANPRRPVDGGCACGVDGTRLGPWLCAFVLVRRRRRA